MSKYPIIVFEGIEGSGKTTHINNVCKFLKKKNKKFIKIREPGGSKNSEKIRKLILNNKSKFSEKTDLLLMLSARSENVDKILSKHLNKIINKFILNKIKPDLTFLNIVNKKNLIIRLKKRKNKNRYDNFSYEFYNKVQKGFLKISKGSKYTIIDSNDPLAYNKKKVLNKISKTIKL